LGANENPERWANAGITKIENTSRAAQNFFRMFILSSGSSIGLAALVCLAMQMIMLRYVSRNTDKFLAGKIGGGIAVARRNGQDFTVREMMMFFLANDMVVPGSIHPNVAFGRKPGEVAADEEGMDTTRHFAANVARLVEKLHGGGAEA
jgi:hypothetical protein